MNDDIARRFEDHELAPAYLAGKIEALETLLAELAVLMPPRVIEALDDTAKRLYHWAEKDVTQRDNDVERDRRNGVYDTVNPFREALGGRLWELEKGAVTPLVQPFRAPPEVPPGDVP